MNIPVKTHLDIYSIDEQGELDIDPKKIREFLLKHYPNQTGDFDDALAEYEMDLESTSIDEGYEDITKEDLFLDFQDYASEIGYTID